MVCRQARELNRIGQGSARYGDDWLPDIFSDAKGKIEENSPHFYVKHATMCIILSQARHNTRHLIFDIIVWLFFRLLL